jgi:hypothetical protein
VVKLNELRISSLSKCLVHSKCSINFSNHYHHHFSGSYILHLSFPNSIFTSHFKKTLLTLLNIDLEINKERQTVNRYSCVYGGGTCMKWGG